MGQKLTKGRVVAAILSALFVLSVGFGVLLSGQQAEAKGGPCICPHVYAPVICDNGKTYSNQCIADCRRAENCEPVGFPGPIGF